MRIAILLVLLAGVAHADRKVQPASFDHAGHATKTQVACARCHAPATIGKPLGHATCFTGCHGELAPTLKLREAVPDDKLRFCNPCHAETVLVTPIDRKALARTVPFGGAEHAIQLGHDSHRQIGCDKCHEAGGPRRTALHGRCVGCHGDKPDKTFGLAACEKCHPRGQGRPQLARNEAQIYVRSAFSHARHATRGAARQCTTCHGAIAATEALTLPRPTLASCTTTGCHDGAAAFGATASCTKCHRDVPAGKFDVWRPKATYSHAKHDTRISTKGTAMPCASCHPLAKTGEVLVANHTPCAGCHADDFGAREPITCSACHTGTEPWRPLIADKLPPDDTEFGSAIDHGKHARDCASCHSLTTTRTELRPPRGHRACATAGCHAMAGGPAPQLTACESCHRRELVSLRETDRLSAPWSVRATFRHAGHDKTACTKCHVDMTAKDVLVLARPPKATCAVDGCHDGKGAFKVTGTACTRCHPGARK
jgi:c(7)-type cytochrome triheme protein